MGCYNEECLITKEEALKMKKYDVTLKDEVTYCDIKAMSEEEAIEKALDHWEYRKPSITVSEKKKVRKTIHYSERLYFTQDVLVDENMSEDEIIDLWDKDEIETLGDSASISEEYDDGSAWVE